MAIPDYQTLMLPILRLAAGGETRVPDAADRIADQLGTSPQESNQLLPSGRQRILHNRLRWVKFYMSKAGLISSPRRGRFTATEAGRSLLATTRNVLMSRCSVISLHSNNFYQASHSGNASSTLECGPEYRSSASYTASDPRGANRICLCVHAC